MSKPKRFLSLLLASFFASLLATSAWAESPTLSALELDRVLAAARSKTLERLRLDAELAAVRADVGLAEAPHDTILFGNLFWQQDRSESAVIFNGDRRDKLLGEVGVRKVLPTATQLEAKLTQSRDYTDYPPANPAGGFDVSTIQSYNPARETKVEVMLVQPLWRNWLGREFEQQRRLLTSGIVPAELNLQLQEQMVQAEIEQTYWNLAEVEAQLRLTERLIGLSVRFAAHMRERIKYGRADQVDLAGAEAQVVAQEGRFLDLYAIAEHYRRRLRMALDPAAPMPADVTAPTPVGVPVGVLTRGGLGRAAATPEAAYELALQQRLDLRLLDEQRAPLRAQIDLAKEKNKPSLNAFAGLGTNGLEGRYDRATVDAFDDGKHLSYKLGLAAEVNLQKSELGAREQQTAAQLAVLDARAEAARANARQEVEFAFSGFEQARRKRIQALRAIDSLQVKRDAEYRKFVQARSEEIAVLSYDIEVLAAEADVIAADKLERDSEVRLRTALHAYPKGR